LKTTTTTTTLTRQQVRELVESGTLSRNEELALRMRFGIAAPASMPLEMNDGGDPAMAAELATIEKSIIDGMEAPKQSQTRNKNREKILDTLSKLS